MNGRWIAGYVAAAVGLAGLSTAVAVAPGRDRARVERVAMARPGEDGRGGMMPGHGFGVGSMMPGHGFGVGSMMPGHGFGVGSMMPGHGFGPGPRGPGSGHGGMTPGSGPGMDARMCEQLPEEVRERCVDAIGAIEGGGS